MKLIAFYILCGTAILNLNIITIESKYDVILIIPPSIAPSIAPSWNDLLFRDATVLFNAAMKSGSALMDLNLKPPSDNPDLDFAKWISNHVSKIAGDFGSLYNGLALILTFFEQTGHRITLEEFEKLQSSAIEAELKNIKKLTSDTPFQIMLQIISDGIKTLLRRFQSYRTSNFAWLFHVECLAFNVNHSLGYIHSDRDAIVYQFAENYSRQELLGAMKEMAILFINGLKIVDACQADKFRSLLKSYSFQRLTNEFHLVMDHHKINSRNQIKELMEKFREADRHIAANFWTNSAKNEVTQMVKDSSSLDHEQFVSKVYSFLSEKYYWREFLVVSYDSNASDDYDHYHHITHGNLIHYQRNDPAGRSWYVALVSDPDGSTRQFKNMNGWVDGCMVEAKKYMRDMPFQFHRLSYGCDDILTTEWDCTDCMATTLQSCFQRMPHYVGNFFCVHNDRNVKWKGPSNSEMIYSENYFDLPSFFVQFSQSTMNYTLDSIGSYLQKRELRNVTLFVVG